MEYGIDTKRLRELVAGNGKPITVQVELMGMQRSRFYAYLNGKRCPTVKKLCMIADYYGVTTDYLLGR